REVLDRELVVVGDDLRGVVGREGLERDPGRRGDDLDPALGHDGATGDVQVEHRTAGAGDRTGTWYLVGNAEPAQVGEAPVLVRRGRQGQLLEPLRGLVARQGRH